MVTASAFSSCVRPAIGVIVQHAVQWFVTAVFRECPTGMIAKMSGRMADSSDSLDPNAAASHAEFFAPAYLEKRRRAMELAGAPADMDEYDPKLPAGHAYAIGTSTRLTSYFRRHHRKGAMDITPQDVIDVLIAAGVKDWVLMGLHGYVGYMPDPRATQDVDVMVAYSERQRAKQAIAERWPDLVVRELSQVTRFLDPNDLDATGQPKPVVDLMHPWSPFQELILKEYVIVDGETQHRLPTVEAALVSKYASIVSPHRDREKKEYDSADFRRIAKANHDRLRTDDLRRLAGLVWEGGAEEIQHFVQIALSDEPFPI
jgi:hypothetical protein